MSADILRILVVLIGVGLVAVILIQQPKEGGMSAFAGGGGASSTVFGAKGSGAFLFKLTAALALAFAIAIAALVTVTNQDDVAEIASQLTEKAEKKTVEKKLIPGANKVQEAPKSAIPGAAKIDAKSNTTEKPAEKTGE